MRDALCACTSTQGKEGLMAAQEEDRRTDCLSRRNMAEITRYIAMDVVI